MSFCPFISTPTDKKEPNRHNCNECCFFVYEPKTATLNCAILLTAERASNAVYILSAQNHKQFG